MTKKEDISLSYLKITKVNNTNTINLYHHSKTSKRQYIELLSRLGIKLNLPDLTFDTEQLINKFCNIVVKWKFRENLASDATVIYQSLE